MSEVQQAPTDWVDHEGTPVRWIDEDAPVASAMALWSPIVPCGWHRLLHRTFVNLCAVSGSVRRDVALAAMQVVPGGYGLQLRLYTDDRVLRGIVRKTANRSQGVCQQCARAGRPRDLGEDRPRVLCPRCAAPRLLRRDIDGLLETASFLIRISVPVSQTQIPELLRSDFGAVARAHAPAQPAEAAWMSPAHFEHWVGSWRRAREALPADRAELEESIGEH